MAYSKVFWVKFYNGNRGETAFTMSQETEGRIVYIFELSNNNDVTYKVVFNTYVPIEVAKGYAPGGTWFTTDDEGESGSSSGSDLSWSSG